MNKSIFFDIAILKKLIDTSPAGMLIVDKNRNILFANESFVKMMGYEMDEVLYHNTEKFHVSREAYENFAKLGVEAVSKDKSVSIEYQVKKKDGTFLWIYIIGKLVQGENFILWTVIDISQTKEAQEKLLQQQEMLRYQAHHDALTQLPNRTLFQDRLEHALQKASRNNTKIALLFIDLDFFKEINDSLGHEMGDEVLKVVTKRLQEVTRKEDTLARLGGDEFTVIIEDLHKEYDASVLANKILKALVEPICIGEHKLYISSSIGISLYPQDGSDAQDLLKYADSAMYRAKSEGRNNFQFYSKEMTEIAFERVVMQTGLVAALQKEEFVVFYQPQIDGKTQQLKGVEALVRWEHPLMGLIPPSKFIPLAESIGLIVELDRYVMKTAMKQFAQWYKDGFNPGILALNLAIKQLEQDDFYDFISQIINESGFLVEWLEFEVTESQIMEDPMKAILMLKKLSHLGIRLAIDDFGTGYSSLSYLKKLPLDKLKIDQSFIKSLPDDEEDIAIVRAIIALAQSLHLNTIAEGVETQAQKDFMVENGCVNIQGYFYAKPMSCEQLEVFMKNRYNSIN